MFSRFQDELEILRFSILFPLFDQKIKYVLAHNYSSISQGGHNPENKIKIYLENFKNRELFS